MHYPPLIAFLALLVAGCADSHQLVRQGGKGDTRIAPADSVYVAVSQDGIYGSTTYANSGKMTSEILLSSFAKRLRRVQVARTPQTFDEALGYARDHNFIYLVFPTILHWEDRATEWSGIPDQVEVKVEVVSVATTETAAAAIVKGRSGLGTLGGDHPQDLLPMPIEEFVSSLF